MNARIEQTALLNNSVSSVRYVHGKRLDGLHELGIFCVKDLIEHFPFRYDDFSQVVKIIEVSIGTKNAVLGTIIEAKGRKTARGGYLYEIVVTDESGLLKAVWFNQRWLADSLTKGKEILLLGKAEHYGGYLSMTAPLYTLVDSRSSSTPDSEEDHHIQNVDAGVDPAGIVPVYRANNKVSSNWIKRMIIEARKRINEPLDPLPPKVRMRRRLVSRQIAWRNIHTPVNMSDVHDARLRLAYEQVFWEQLRYALYESKQLEGHVIYKHGAVNTLSRSLKALLPFELTGSQEQAIDDINADMQSGKRMNRFLLGDVGSGKTMVALHALTRAVENGWQATMMAPTEVLANQYARSVGSYLDSLGISWTLLTSALKGNNRKEVLDAISSGATQVVFGTHALIEPDVSFKQLSLIIIDEQHRFGVDHRNALIAKSPSADFLSMSATPIPRSLALVLYGNIQVSYLENRPSKASTSTYLIDSSVSYKAYEAVREALDRGEQAYIVCPLISAPVAHEDDEASFLDDLEGFSDEPYIAAAEAELEHLRLQVFPEKHVELLTSRIKSDEKQRIMDEFKAGRIDILVSTTVIEVGVDVPNATVMMILDADRFGLAQLHQLRGRVGRGTQDAQVFLVTKNPGESARRRLRLMEENSDGLTLSEADLLERREGDLAGTRQHGASSLSLVNVVRDAKLIEAAHTDVAALLEKDPDLSLPEHLLARFEVEEFSGFTGD